MLTFPDLTPQNCAISVEDCHNGQYLATFVCTKACVSVMHVTLKGDKRARRVSSSYSAPPYKTNMYYLN